MSATNIVVPPELDQDVSEWSEDDVEMFLMANIKKYGLIDTDIQAVRVQRVRGMDLLLLDGADFERCGILIGPARRIVALVEKLKVTKGLVRLGK